MNFLYLISCVILFLTGAGGDDDGAPDKCFVTLGENDRFDSKLCVDSAGLAYVVDLDDPTMDFTFDVDTMFLIFCGFLVFFMQIGFAMLEAGAVHPKNIQNILYKNLMDASIGCVLFYLIGYGFAFGDENDGPFIGSSNFALVPGFKGLYKHWFFQWTFVATSATIVSGAVAERCRLYAYFGYTSYLTVWVYPVVVHWMWDDEGWLRKMGMIDFAGSGVVHLVGGVSGFIGAVWLGPRWDTFDSETFEPKVKQVAPHETLLHSVGTVFLWFGWYGFNCGSALGISGRSDIVARAAICTTLAAASAGITSACLSRLLYSQHNLCTIFNGILTGLVSICASVATIEPYMAIPIGFGGAITYHAVSRGVLAAKVDDPVDAVAVHAGGGTWGLLCAGIFSSPKLIDEVYTHTSGETYVSGKQFGIQLLGWVCVFSWALFNGLIIFGFMKRYRGIRVTIEVEKLGLDSAEHGGVKLMEFSGNYRNTKINSIAKQFGVTRQMATSNGRQGFSRAAPITAIVPSTEQPMKRHLATIE